MNVSLYPSQQVAILTAEPRRLVSRRNLDRNGKYLFQHLPPGKYVVAINGWRYELIIDGVRRPASSVVQCPADRQVSVDIRVAGRTGDD
jgi:hypothetical protein